MKTYSKSLLSMLALVCVTHPWLRAEEAVKADAKLTVPAIVEVGRVGDQVLTEDQMMREAGLSIFDAQMQAYNAKRTWIERQAKAILFAKAAKGAKLSLEAWKAKELDAKILTPTDAEVDQRVQQYTRGQTIEPARLADMKNQVRGALLNERRTVRETEIYQQLAAATTIQVLIPKPVAPTSVVIYGPENPVKGPADAPVTIVEFTDFQCPWCSRAQEALHAVEKAYPGKVKMITRHFPLGMHPRAIPAAEAAACAQEQGKFWEYHDKLFANQQKLEAADLASYAKELGLNEKKFDRCVKDRKYKALVEKDQADGALYGVQGTPTFFVNNHKTNFNQLAEAVRSALGQ